MIYDLPQEKDAHRATIGMHRGIHMEACLGEQDGTALVLSIRA